MALPSTGPIKFSDINVELGLAANTPRKLSDSAVRTLFGVASGRITLSNGRGKANSFTFNKTISTNTQNYNLRSDAIAAGWDGVVVLNATVTVNSGVYVWSDSTATAGFDTGSSFPAGTTLSIINNGFIIGRGGNGGNGITAGANAGPAMNIGYSVAITNNNYIAGGGGGGAGAVGSTNSAGWSVSGGGGGAGGGRGGGTNGGAGGANGSSGSNGGANTANSSYGTGAGGGRVLPGTGGVARSVSLSGQGVTNGFPGFGGGSGGSGGAGWALIQYIPDRYGGLMPIIGVSAGGGGGGWGASGGQTVTLGTTTVVTVNSGVGGSSNNTGAIGSITGGGATQTSGTVGVGGKAVNLNGNTVTWLANGTRWGAIS